MHAKRAQRQRVPQRVARPFVAVALSMVCALAATASAEASEKKGAAINKNAVNIVDRINSIDVSWYYTWGITPVPGLDDEEFVPMIWGGGKEFHRRLAELEADPGPEEVLLGFNEPDLKGQADMSVDAAVELWRELDGTAERIGSPAAANALGDWMREFMERAETEDLQVDFITVHWYGPPNPKGFLSFVDKVHEAYGLPIWITEFAIADWQWREHGANRYSEWQVACFLRQVLPELERRPFVERYAWFASRSGDPARSSQFFTETGKLTPVGQLYADFGDTAAAPTQAPAEACMRG